MPQELTVPPPHVMGIAVLADRVLITFSPDFDPAIAGALGGEQHSQDFGAWAFPAADDAAAGAVLQKLRDRGIPFFWVDGGWPPAAVFEEFRDRGLVTGTVSALSFYGSGRWTLRTL